MYPSPEAIAEVRKMRYADLLTMSRRLERVACLGRAKWYASAAWACVGAGIGAALALIPLLGADLDDWVMTAYICAVITLFIVSKLFAKAAEDVRDASADSVEAIKADLDILLNAYDPQGLVRTSLVRQPPSPDSAHE
jgi:hypothetical protein